VLKYYEVPETGERIVRLRNPWRTEQYSLKYSDSSYWSAAAKRAVGDDFVVANDGLFFIPADILYDATDSYYISYIEMDWKINFIEGTDDGSSYTFTINNPTAQEVFIVVDVPNERGNQCIQEGSSVDLKWLRPDWSDYDYTGSSLSSGFSMLR